MTENEEFYKLTFSQREGRAPLPEPMRLKHVSGDFRNLVWRAVDNAIKHKIRDAFGYYSYETNNPMYHIVSEYTIKVLHWPHDYIKHKPHEHQELLREKILEKNLIKFLHSSSLFYVTISVRNSYKTIWKMLSKKCPLPIPFKPLMVFRRLFHVPVRNLVPPPNRQLRQLNRAGQQEQRHIFMMRSKLSMSNVMQMPSGKASTRSNQWRGR